MTSFTVHFHGVSPGDHDITDVYVDGTLKMGGKDYESLVHFLDRLSAVVEEENVNMLLTISCDESELPEGNSSRCRDRQQIINSFKEASLNFGEASFSRSVKALFSFLQSGPAPAAQDERKRRRSGTAVTRLGVSRFG